MWIGFDVDRDRILRATRLTHDASPITSPMLSERESRLTTRAKRRERKIAIHTHKPSATCHQRERSTPISCA